MIFLFLRIACCSRRFVSLLCLSILCMPALPVKAGVSVTFTNPGSYADMPASEAGRTDVLKALEIHFETLAKRLPSNSMLKIEVLDIDLAGRLESGIRYPVDMRILRGSADWPAMSLRYRLEENETVVKSGETRLTDMNYLRHHNRYAASDLIRYEKAMIDDWFRQDLLGNR